jgi:hypothetical protein
MGQAYMAKAKPARASPVTKNINIAKMNIQETKHEDNKFQPYVNPKFIMQ